MATDSVEFRSYVENGLSGGSNRLTEKQTEDTEVNENNEQKIRNWAREYKRCVEQFVRFEKAAVGSRQYKQLCASHNAKQRTDEIADEVREFLGGLEGAKFNILNAIYSGDENLAVERAREQGFLA